jgi:hypothetical protein
VASDESAIVERVRRRPPPAAVLVVALGLLVVGILGAATTILLVVRQHHEDVVKLRRDPSYQYGYAVNPYNRTMNYATTPHIGCQEFLMAHPAHFPGYSLSKALRGCVDKSDLVND